jgi:hypothetical protein
VLWTPGKGMEITNRRRNADPTVIQDGGLLFVKPWEEEQLFSNFLEYITRQELEGINLGEIRYAQTCEDSQPSRDHTNFPSRKR